MTDISGQIQLDLSENVSPLGLFSKMCQALFPTLTPSSKIWKVKTTTGKRSLLRLAQSTPPTKGKGYGLLPSPTASTATSESVIGKDDTFKMTSNGTLRKYNRNGINGSLGLGRLLTLKNGLDLLPTPTATNAIKEQRIMKPSPSDLNGRSLPQRLGMLMGTPIASQTHKPIRRMTPSEATGKHGINTVASIGEMHPTLVGKKINPQFLEWMLGFPKDWTKVSHCQE